MSFLKQKLTKELFNYGLFGLSRNIGGYILYLLMTELGIGHKVAMTLLYLIGALGGFFFNKNITFSHQGDVYKTGMKYSLFHLSGYLLNFFLLFYFVDIKGHAHQWIQAISILIVALYLFTAFKIFVFKTPQRHTIL